jgi:hypothetical protein
MSTIVISNIKATGETASRAVSGVAAVHFGFSQSAITYFGMSTNTLSSQSFNVSSFTDNDIGDATVALTNAMANTGYTYLSGAIATNNTRTLDSLSTASSLTIKSNDGDSNTAQDSAGWAALMGDLA